MLRMDCICVYLGIGGGKERGKKRKKKKKLIGFGSDCIVMIVKVQGQGMDNSASNSAARRWQTSGCVKRRSWSELKPSDGMGRRVT